MSSVTSANLPSDYPQRIKSARGARGLTQSQFANLIGVSYASVNRWENGQSRPNNLAWRHVVELEKLSSEGIDGVRVDSENRLTPSPSMDFSADPSAVSVVAEAHRLAYGHLFNPAFATETSLIDPLPHQRIAVYDHMLQQAPLRFLLADDAGAGKTIMTGLYVREMLSRRLIRRVLIVAPAGLVGNWEREMRTLFRLPFRIVSGTDTRSGNPFVGSESDRIIVSIDTLTGNRMFGHLKDRATQAYDLVVFDEAHKLSADREPDFRVRKRDRYKLAEAIAGAGSDSEAWSLHWSAQHLLLLTATPHMGKDYPYYFLWRLLLPDTLSTYDAFHEFPRESRRRHFIRRTKEEMVHFDGSQLYPQRNCDTLSYDLSQGPKSEQELYDETTDYIRYFYNRARVLNRSAARLAMSVFQRRLASSTYALMRSFERRKEKLKGLIDAILEGRLTEEKLGHQQRRLDDLDDVFEMRTADEDAVSEGDGEQHEEFEAKALTGTVAANLSELEAECLKVDSLLDMARARLETGEESKFEKLREVLRDPNYIDEKFIVFTEHRDTAEFLVRRLEGLGFTGRVALIHGGLPYQERERQIEFFRRPLNEGGAGYLVATDAAGEGINLQFCWLMVNYDIPWNPARLEQRMGRIHRYGQAHDPVVIVNLVAGSTREGRVLKTLLDKLEAIRRQLQSDKVFDVVGRLFEGLSMRDYLEQAVTEAMPTSLLSGWRAILRKSRSGLLSSGSVCSLETAATYAGNSLISTTRQSRRPFAAFCPGTSVASSSEPRRCSTCVSRAIWKRPLPWSPTVPVRPIPCYWRLRRIPRTHEIGSRCTSRGAGKTPSGCTPASPCSTASRPRYWVCFGRDGLKGAVFVDPYAPEAYLFHVALVSVEQDGQVNTGPTDLWGDRESR